MIGTNELLSGLEEIQLIIIKVAEVVGIVLVCALGLKFHFDKLGRTKGLKRRNAKRKKVKKGESSTKQTH